MAEGRRSPGIFTMFGVLLLIGSIAATAWWLNRPPAPIAPPLDPEQLDVFCSGRVDAAGQVIALEPSQAGRVVEVVASEGATVTKDQPLIVLDSSSADARVIQAEASVEAAEIDFLQATRMKERFPNQLAARTSMLNASSARVEAARKMLQQRREQQQLTPLGRAELEMFEAQIKEVEQLEAAERGQLDDLKKMDGELDLRIRGAVARKKLAHAERALADKLKKECTLTAPGPGTILRLQATVGGYVSPGTPIPPIVFAPAGAYVVRAEIDQEALGRVKDGMKVIVHDENRPDGPQWKGSVKAVGRWVAMRRTMILEPGEISDVRTVECVIELNPGGDPLWIGQRMRVRILRGADSSPEGTRSTSR